MADDILIDPTGSYFTKSTNSLEHWKKNQERKEKVEQLDIEGLDPNSLEAAGLLVQDEIKQAATASPDLTRTAESLAEHSGFDRLSLDTEYNQGELENLNDPRWKHVYDTNKDGVVDNRDDYGRDMMNFGRKRDATTVAMERKHAYTSGTGKADAVTNIIEAKNATHTYTHR